MTNEILDFLTGGVFTTLKELVENVVQWVITFVTNTTYKFFTPLIDLVLSIFPIVPGSGSFFEVLINTFSPYIYFILDSTFISRPILIYLISSIIFRITVRLQSYMVKLILQWYKALMP